ncbi:unnamed protein product [Staurois parvus]|uniref:Small ribosomal subunit protein uS10 domain-containing protein n=1 Tax=Staurois parvus TaxID=386267 RepID=A0ABN9CVP5_9NEOB|nr:unnamed protein product [Staurois parvus]
MLINSQQVKKKSKPQKEIKEGTDYEYGTLNFQVTGYNMYYVEKFVRYIHKFFNQMSIAVEESYALQTRSKEILVQQDAKSKMTVDYILTTHERVIQVSGLKATLAPIILEVMMMNQPEGVQLQVIKVRELFSDINPFKPKGKTNLHA